MRLRFSAAFLAVLAAALLVATASGAAMIEIYRNGMETTAQRAQLIKLAGASCTRGGSDGALRIAIGKATDACSYRTPVLGRNLEISATERLLSGTPTALQRKAYLALELRAGAGAKYQLLAFPLQRKVQLLKVTGEGTEYLAVQKDVKGLMGVNKANALRLRVLKPAKGQAQLSAYVSGELVAEATDEAAGDLTGAASSVAVGAVSGANGVIASVDDVVVRVPVAFPATN
jgi:hypothetical protein